MLTSIHYPSCAADCAGGIISISVIQFFYSCFAHVCFNIYFLHIKYGFCGLIDLIIV